MSADAASASAPAAGAAEDALKDKGLVKVNNLYLVEADAKLPDDLKNFRAVKKKSDDDNKKRTEIEGNIRTAKGVYDHIGILVSGLMTHWQQFGQAMNIWLRVMNSVVGTLMLRRHERARFSAYVFLSCEIVRANRIHSWPLGLLAVVSILYLQLPAARRFHPMVDPRKVMARLRLKPPPL